MFDEGGPHRMRRTGHDEFEMTVPLPVDNDGMQGRECPAELCAPAFFKVRPGTGVAVQASAFCPYCRCEREPSDFTTPEQKEFAMALAKGEAIKGMNRMVRRALDIGPSNRRKLVEGIISLELKFEPASAPYVPPPAGDELRRDVVCPHCTLAQAVYGLAVWCADCGADIFMTHVEEEAAVVGKMLAAIPDRLALLGPRVAARDLENALEDVVSIFEGSLKALVRRHLAVAGNGPDQVAEVLSKTVATRFQSPTIGAEVFQRLTGQELLTALDESQRAEFASLVAKRHPITHNLGVVDRKYLAHAKSEEKEGRDVRLTPDDVQTALALTLHVLRSAHGRLFPNPPRAG